MTPIGLLHYGKDLTLIRYFELFLIAFDASLPLEPMINAGPYRVGARVVYSGCSGPWTECRYPRRLQKLLLSREHTLRSSSAGHMRFALLFPSTGRAHRSTRSAHSPSHQSFHQLSKPDGSLLGHYVKS